MLICALADAFTCSHLLPLQVSKDLRASDGFRWFGSWFGSCPDHSTQKIWMLAFDSPFHNTLTFSYTTWLTSKMKSRALLLACALLAAFASSFAQGGSCPYMQQAMKCNACCIRSNDQHKCFQDGAGCIRTSTSNFNQPSHRDINATEMIGVLRGITALASTRCGAHHSRGAFIID